MKTNEKLINIQARGDSYGTRSHLIVFDGVYDHFTVGVAGDQVLSVGTVLAVGDRPEVLQFRPRRQKVIVQGVYVDLKRIKHF